MEKEDEKFFYEDEVAMSSKTGLVKYGLVLTTNRHKSESELQMNNYKSPNDIKVMWYPNGIEEILPDDKVVLMDRSLMPGDVVRKVSESKPSQFGYCENIDIYVTVKIINTNKIIENISSRNLVDTKPFAVDSSVFYESWVGGVNNVKCKITFASQDGSIFTLEDPFRQDFISISTSDNFSLDENVFYPGQKLKVCLENLENAKFVTVSNLMHCLWHNFRKFHKLGSKWIKVYVQDISVSSVEVEWYCQTSGKPKPREEHWPERIITGDNLKKLKTIDLFDSCSIQMGDTQWYKIKDTDNLITMKQWRTKCTEAFNSGPGLLSYNNNKDRHHNKLLDTKKYSKSMLSNELENIDELYPKIQNPSATKMQRNERLSNGENNSAQSKQFESKPSTSTSGNSSKLKLKSNRLKRNHMWKLLVKKNKQLNVPKVSTKSNSNVVVEVCYTKSIVDIIWQDGTREIGVSSTDLYPVQTLDDLEFFPGDFVTETNPPMDVYGVIESVDHVERTARVQWFKVFPEKPSLPIPIEKTDFSVYDLRDHPDFHFKSGCLIIYINPDSNPDVNTLTAGQVLSAGPDGRILVMWVNGEKTTCWPQELFIVKIHDDDGFSFQDEEYDDVANDGGGDDDDDDDDNDNDNDDDDDDDEYEDDDDDNDDDDDDDDDNNDVPLTVDDCFVDWIYLTTPKSTNRKRNHENIDKFPRAIYQLIMQATGGLKALLDTAYHNTNLNVILNLQEPLEDIKLGFNVSSLLAPSETTAITSSYNVVVNTATKLVDKIVSGIGNKEGAEVDPEFQSLIEEFADKLKYTVFVYMKKINQAITNSYGPNHIHIIHVYSPSGVTISFEHCREENQSEEDQSDDQSENDNLDMDVMEIIESTSPRSIYEQDSTECNFMSMDTDAEPECEVITKPEEAGVFVLVEALLDNSHKYINDKNTLHTAMLKIINKDIQILQKSLPAGIWVKTFESRMDLFSIMIRGPEKTPYAGGLFLFDIKIPHTYPLQPPLCHYYSFCDDRLNPNLYEDGKVCLSLLGTWSGHGVELWSPKDSNLLQLLVSIQGLILVSEPYYNEAGFDSQRGQKLASGNSRVYNEMVLIKVVQSMTNMLTAMIKNAKNPGYFKEEIIEHLKLHGPKLINTIENWIRISEKDLSEDEKLVPGFPLLPLSKGFCLSVKKALNDYREILVSMNIMFK